MSGAGRKRTRREDSEEEAWEEDEGSSSSSSSSSKQSRGILREETEEEEAEETNDADAEDSGQRAGRPDVQPLAPYAATLRSQLFSLSAGARFSTGGALPASLRTSLTLSVTGVGPVPLPLTVGIVRALLAASQPSLFGHRERTLMDKLVRDSSQVDASLVRLPPEWLQQLHASLFSRLNTELGLRCQAPEELQLQLYKLLLYPPGAHFAKHRDSEKVPGMFGTLVLLLPSDYDGGALLVQQPAGALVKAYDYADVIRDSGELHFIAFFADCEHELKQVTRGCRAALVFNLVRVDRTGILPRGAASSTPALDRSRVEQVASSLREWLSSDPASPLAIVLRHEYSQAELLRRGAAALKSTDATVHATVAAAASLLQGSDADGGQASASAAAPTPPGGMALPPQQQQLAVASSSYTASHTAASAAAMSASPEQALRLPASSNSAAPPAFCSSQASQLVQLHLCELEARQSGYFEDEFNETGANVEADEVVALHECPLPEQAGERGLPLTREHLLLPPDLSEAQLYEQEVEHTGNEGATFERWYRRWALVLLADRKKWTTLVSAAPQAWCERFFTTVDKMLRGAPAGGSMPDLLRPDVQLDGPATLCQLAEVAHALVSRLTSALQRVSSESKVRLVVSLLRLIKHCSRPDRAEMRHDMEQLIKRMLKTKGWVPVRSTSYWSQGDIGELVPSNDHADMLLLLASTESFGLLAVRRWLQRCGDELQSDSGRPQRVQRLASFFIGLSSLLANGVESDRSSAGADAPTVAFKPDPALGAAAISLRAEIEHTAVRTLAVALTSSPDSRAHTITAASSGSRSNRPFAAAAVASGASSAQTELGAAIVRFPSASAMHQLDPEELLAAIRCLALISLHWTHTLPLLSHLCSALDSRLSAWPAESSRRSAFRRPAAASDEPLTFVRERIVPFLLQLDGELARRQRMLQSNSEAKSDVTAAAATASSASASMPPPAAADSASVEGRGAAPPLGWLQELHCAIVARLSVHLRNSELPAGGQEWRYPPPLVAQLGETQDGCAHCVDFASFLASDSRVHEVKAAEKVRKHVEYTWCMQTPRRYGYQSSGSLPGDLRSLLRGVTLTTGSPHTFSVSKERSYLDWLHTANVADAVRIGQLQQALALALSSEGSGERGQQTAAAEWLPYPIDAAEARIHYVSQAAGGAAVGSSSSGRAAGTQAAHRALGTSSTKRGRRS